MFMSLCSKLHHTDFICTKRICRISTIDAENCGLVLHRCITARLSLANKQQVSSAVVQLTMKALKSLKRKYTSYSTIATELWDHPDDSHYGTITIKMVPQFCGYI